MIAMSQGLAEEVAVMRLHVGCAMWTHAAWQSTQLPHPLAAQDLLRARTVDHGSPALRIGTDQKLNWLMFDA